MGLHISASSSSCATFRYSGQGFILFKIIASCICILLVISVDYVSRTSASNCVLLTDIVASHRDITFGEGKLG